MHIPMYCMSLLHGIQSCNLAVGRRDAIFPQKLGTNMADRVLIYIACVALTYGRLRSGRMTHEKGVYTRSAYYK